MVPVASYPATCLLWTAVDTLGALLLVASAKLLRKNGEVRAGDRDLLVAVVWVDVHRLGDVD